MFIHTWDGPREQAHKRMLIFFRGVQQPPIDTMSTNPGLDFCFGSKMPCNVCPLFKVNLGTQLSIIADIINHSYWKYELVIYRGPFCKQLVLGMDDLVFTSGHKKNIGFSFLCELRKLGNCGRSGDTSSKSILLLHLFLVMRFSQTV